MHMYEIVVTTSMEYDRSGTSLYEHRCIVFAEELAEAKTKARDMFKHCGSIQKVECKNIDIFEIEEEL